MITAMHIPPQLPPQDQLLSFLSAGSGGRMLLTEERTEVDPVTAKTLSRMTWQTALPGNDLALPPQPAAKAHR